MGCGCDGSARDPSGKRGSERLTSNEKVKGKSRLCIRDHGRDSASITQRSLSYIRLLKFIQTYYPGKTWEELIIQNTE